MGTLAGDPMGSFGDLSVKGAGTEPWGVPKFECVEKETSTKRPGKESDGEKLDRITLLTAQERMCHGEVVESFKRCKEAKVSENPDCPQNLVIRYVTVREGAM